MWFQQEHSHFKQSIAMPYSRAFIIRLFEKTAEIMFSCHFFFILSINVITGKNNLLIQTITEHNDNGMNDILFLICCSFIALRPKRCESNYCLFSHRSFTMRFSPVLHRSHASKNTNRHCASGDLFKH